MAVLVAEINMRPTIAQFKLDAANKVMMNIGLTNEGQREVKEYFQMTQNLKDHQDEFDVFLSSICPSLKMTV